MKVALLFALVFAACGPASAAAPAPAPNRFAAPLAPAERFEVGATLVERHGQRGRPLIMIPGLGSGPWVWQELVREYSGRHSVYVLTLPGFDGRPPVNGAGFEAARRSLQQLIETRLLSKQDKPVLIGHSMGGALALAVAARSPDLVAGVIAVDGLPLLPGTEGMAVEQRALVAAGARAGLAALASPAFAAQQQQYMRALGVLDMPSADQLAGLSGNSDPAAVARYMADTLALDLRPELPAIKAPVLVLAPYFQPDAEQIGMTAEAKTAYYKSLMAGTPQVEVVSIAGARHFVMIDQPRQVSDAIARFLQSL